MKFYKYRFLLFSFPLSSLLDGLLFQRIFMESRLSLCKVNTNGTTDASLEKCGKAHFFSQHVDFKDRLGLTTAPLQTDKILYQKNSTVHKT
jgi:hypothetical protein